MSVSEKEFRKFGDIFPHMENILQCGIYYYSSTSPEDNYWSQGIYNIYGIEPFSVPCTPQSLLPYIVAEDRERVMAAAQSSRNNQTPYKMEFSIVNAKGEYKRLYAENSFTRKNEDPESYEGVIKDVTENYFYRKALEQKVKQLDKSNQSLQEFVYIASHDLQEPLRKISTFVGRLKSRFEGLLGEEGDMYVGRILNSTQNMQTLLEDLLNFSRLSFSDKPYEQVDIKACLQNSLNDLSVKIEETHAEIIVPDKLPMIEGYPVQLKQLFQNLIGNALKFCKAAQPPHIIVDASEISGNPELHPGLKNKSYLQILIKDNGIGFEQEFSERIFKIFQRLNGKSEYPGSGVGLAICKRIVDNHHGVIKADGDPNQGAVFTIFLPIKQNG